jgi:hypothetical protein
MRPLRSTRLLALLVVLSASAFAWQNPTESTAVNPDEGHVSDGVYVNKFFGFSYRIPSGLVPQSTEFKEHRIDPSKPARKNFVLFLAAVPVKPYRNVAINAMSASDLNDGAAYLQKTAAVSKTIGLTVLNEPEPRTLAGKNFFRQDYYSPRGPFYQTHVCTIYKGYALDFVISASNREDIEPLFDSLNALRFETPTESLH